MTFPTHLAAGLVIGKITGEYPAALIGSVFMDADHLLSLAKHRQLLPRKLWRAAWDPVDRYGDQRGMLHNIFVACMLTALVALIWPGVAAAFGAAYLAHLLFDALDGSGCLLFWPLWKWNVKGPVTYATRREWGVALGLVGMFLVF